jgi:ABC-type multidrug transport system fused ATPase/permease subunit
MYIFKIFFEFIQKYKITLICYLIFSLLSFPLESILVPQLYSHFFESINNKTKIEVFIKYFVLILALLSLVNISNCITSYIESFMIPEVNEYVINYIFKNLLYKYEDNYTDIELGKIITRLSNIPGFLKDFITEICVWIIPRFLTIIIINIYFFYLNWKLGLASFILLIIFILFNFKYFKKCSILSNNRHVLFENKNQITQDKLSNTFSIYSNGNVKNEIKNYEDDTSVYTYKYKETLFCLNKINIFTCIIIILNFILLNSTATYLFIKKEISFTSLMAIFITVIYYTPCIITINSTIPNLIHGYGILTAVDEFIKDLYEINNIHKIKNEKDDIDIPIKDGSIIINNLNFGYTDDKLLFKNFYLTIKNNESVAIIGPSGNGKSSLIKLIMGYFKVADNTVFIDNIDINKFKLNDLRKQISYVNQNSKLFNMTIMENIQYGNNMTEDEIINKCKNLNVDNIFKNLPNGYNTNVGVDGNNLSGGQRQLIHILRTIFKNNKIIILDEPTSAIDKDNTENIVNIIKEISKNSTLILITHDESILNLVNRVITLDSGKIISDQIKET